MVTAPTKGNRTPVRVLVADDSDLLVGLIASWLEDEGYAVVTATTGQQALDGAAVHHPDVVLLDLIMPPPDGFDVCAKLKRLPHPPEIILMTGISDAAHVNRALDLCAATLLRKPLDADTVVAAVASAVRRRKHPRRGVTNSHK
jgi:two-component system, cell cycle response regulator